MVDTIIKALEQTMEIITTREIKALYSLGGIDKKKWVSVDSLKERLKEMLNDDLNSALDDCVLFSSVEKLVKELESKGE